MSVVTISSLGFGALLVAWWLFYAVGMAAWIHHRMKGATGRSSYVSPAASPRRAWVATLKSVPFILVGSAFLVINGFVFLVWGFWYRLLRRPLPRPPQYGSRYH